MIMVDWQIKNAKLLSPCNEDNLTPNGYDVSIDDINVSLDSISEEGCWGIPPKEKFVILTNETIKLPNNIVGNIWIKTKWARKGIITSAGVIDLGFKGKLNLCCYNSSRDIIILKKDDKFAQVVFSIVNAIPSKTYEERSGNYQGQDKIVK